MPDIFGIGVDVVEISRIGTLRQRHGPRMKEIIFTEREAEYCETRVNVDECFAARFAAKEAVMKALGTGWTEGVTFPGIEVVRTDNGKPEIILHGSTKTRAKELGAGKIFLSLSHSRETAIAQVLIEKNPDYQP